MSVWLEGRRPGRSRSWRHQSTIVCSSACAFAFLPPARAAPSARAASTHPRRGGSHTSRRRSRRAAATRTTVGHTGRGARASGRQGGRPFVAPPPPDTAPQDAQRGCGLGHAVAPAAAPATTRPRMSVFWATATAVLHRHRRYRYHRPCARPRRCPHPRLHWRTPPPPAPPCPYAPGRDTHVNRPEEGDALSERSLCSGRDGHTRRDASATATATPSSRVPVNAAAAG